MPSLEMLKKLLDEFSEKEAHAREEINVITEQIGELEKRVLASQAKLSTVSGDREKVRMMQDRYSSGSTLTSSGGQPSAQTSSSSLPEEPKEKESRTRPGRAERAAAAAAAVTPPSPPPLPEPGIPPAPLNMRASSTRLPDTKPVSETPAESSSPFLSAPDPIPASQAVSNPFTSAHQSPLDLFSAPLPQEPAPAPEVDANRIPYPESQVQYSGTTEVNYTSAQPVDTGVQTNYTSSQPVDPGVPTNYTSAQPVDSGLPSNESSSPFFRPTSRPETIEQAALPQAEAVPQTFIQPSADPQQAQPQPVSPQDDPGAQIQDLEEDEPDDTVKSINDALRGLFR